MAASKYFTLTLMVALLPSTFSANINITSPPITNWGEWGRMERCPFGRYAQGFQLQTEPNQFLGDDTALNTIRLFCGDPHRPDTAIVTGFPQGDFGDWGNVYSCFPGILNGFQLRSEPNQQSLDDTAANNIRFFCSSLPTPSDYIEGDGAGWGSWTQEQRCLTGQGICAIQTQIEPDLGDGDDTMLNNVRFECSDRLTPAQEASAAAAIPPQNNYTTVADLNILPENVKTSFDLLKSLTLEKSAGEKKVEVIKAAEA